MSACPGESAFAPGGTAEKAQKSGQPGNCSSATSVSGPASAIPWPDFWPDHRAHAANSGHRIGPRWEPAQASVHWLPAPGDPDWSGWPDWPDVCAIGQRGTCVRRPVKACTPCTFLAHSAPHHAAHPRWCASCRLVGGAIGSPDPFAAMTQAVKDAMAKVQVKVTAAMDEVKAAVARLAPSARSCVHRLAALPAHAL
jgi:hypothetical protein